MVASGWWLGGAFEAGVGGVIGGVLTQEFSCLAFDLILWKNEAIAGGLPGKSFALMAQEEFGGFGELAALLDPALFLEGAELLECFLELAGEAAAVKAKLGELVDDNLGRWQGLLVSGLGEQAGFEQGDTVEPPGGLGEFQDELSFGGVGGLVFVAELAAVLLVGGRVFRRQDGGAGSEAMAEGVERGALFAGFGARAGGVLGIFPIDGGAVDFGAVHGFAAFEPAEDGVALGWRGLGCG
jgi:hypothetical protein